MGTQNLVISFKCSWFLAKNLAYAECSIMIFHYRNSSTVPIQFIPQIVLMLREVKVTTKKLYHHYNKIFSLLYSKSVHCTSKCNLIVISHNSSKQSSFFEQMYGYLALYNLGVLISWAKNVYQKLYCKCKSHLYNCWIMISKDMVRLGNILTPTQLFGIILTEDNLMFSATDGMSAYLNKQQFWYVKKYKQPSQQVT